MSKLDFLSGDAGETEVVPEPQAEETGGPARGPDGKFISAASEPAAAEEAPAPEAAPAEAAPVAEPAAAAPAPAPAVEPIPISALLDEREKRQKLERELEALKAKQVPAAEPEPITIPNPAEDPEGFARFMQGQLEERAFVQTREISRRFAVQQLGEETVQKIQDWAFQRCEEDPHFNAQVRNSDDPYGFAKRFYDQAQILETVKPTELDEFRAWQAAKAQAAAAPQEASAPQPAAAPAPKPPVSLVSAPSGGGPAGSPPTGPGQAFDAVFNPR